jgi:hypothetical protein
MHADAERRMRELIEQAGLPEPEEVRYEFDPDEVVLMWHEPRFAVVVDLEDTDGGDVELPLASKRETAPP